MADEKQSWKDIKQAISGWSETQLVWLVQDLYRMNSKNADFLPTRTLFQIKSFTHFSF